MLIEHFIADLGKLPLDKERTNQGWCLNFAILLRNLFPDVRLVMNEDFHVAGRTLDGRVFDCTGRLDPENFKLMTLAEVRSAHEWRKAA